jgi:hypothetical protein
MQVSRKGQPESGTYRTAAYLERYPCPGQQMTLVSDALHMHLHIMDADRQCV